jgi:hypothetical protein
LPHSNGGGAIRSSTGSSGGDQPGYGDDLHPGLDKPESGLAHRDNQQPAGLLIVPRRQLTRLISNDLQLVEPVLWSTSPRHGKRDWPFRRKSECQFDCRCRQLALRDAEDFGAPLRRFAWRRGADDCSSPWTSILAAPADRSVSRAVVTAWGPRSETHVHVRFNRDAHVATCASREERTCTCVPPRVEELMISMLGWLSARAATV